MTETVRHCAFAKSIATVSLSGTLPEKLDAAAAAGFDGVEIFENDLLTFDGSPADVRRIAEGLGLSITLFQPFRDFEAMPEPVRTRNLGRAERKFDIMEALGTDLILVCSNVQSHAIGDPARAAADLAEMAERAAARGLRVGYEALAWGRHVNRWRQAWDIVQRAGHPALGLVVDSFHTLSLGDDPSGIADVPADRLFFVQLADAPKLSMDVLSWSRHFRNFPGQGQLDVTGFVRAVIASGYRGPLSLEIFNDDFRAAPARTTAADGLRSLVLAETQAAAPLPAPPAYDGFEFLEFAVDGRARGALAGYLETLGFRRAGGHKSKDVHLYRQGRIHLVLNSEPDSAAAEHFQMHGPSVCAMALRVADAGPVLARAEALHYSTYRERTGEGERDIPAVRAPDGTLVYLVETGAPSIWADDFRLDVSAGMGGSGGGLACIDHVALALPPGRMDSFVLFYRAVFGFEPEQLWELPDPYGLIRSRAMVSPDRTVRLPLNFSESRKTATGRFLSALAGAGVHHVAFATDRIEQAITAATRADAPMLPVPENYYDDLAARLALDDETLAMLRRCGLMYDQDEHGDFTHAYTDAFEDRFFLEIVQRRGYQQFGAINASVRMAMQAQLRADTQLRTIVGG